MDNFERVLLLLFEEDIVTGHATGKVLKFLNLDPFPKDLDEVHVNVSGYPQNRVLHRLMTDGHPGSDQYKKYNCLILIDNPSVHDLFPSLEHAFYYQKRHCKKCHLLNMIFFAVKNLF